MAQARKSTSASDCGDWRPNLATLLTLLVLPTLYARFGSLHSRAEKETECKREVQPT